jgi:hypothetical protein
VIFSWLQVLIFLILIPPTKKGNPFIQELPFYKNQQTVDYIFLVVSVLAESVLAESTLAVVSVVTVVVESTLTEVESVEEAFLLPEQEAKEAAITTTAANFTKDFMCVEFCFCFHLIRHKPKGNP